MTPFISVGRPFLQKAMFFLPTRMACVRIRRVKKSIFNWSYIGAGRIQNVTVGPIYIERRSGRDPQDEQHR